MLPIFLINLADRPKRLVSALSELRKVNLTKSIIRQEACTPELAQENIYENFTERAVENIRKHGDNKCLLPTWGAAGCALSHKQCWRQFLRSDFETCLIIEDDITIDNPETFLFKFNQAKSSFKVNQRNSQGKPIMWLFGSNSYPNQKQEISDDLEIITGCFTGLHCYLINRAGAELLNNYCQQISYQLDIEIGRLLLRGDKLTYPGLTELTELTVYNSFKASIKQNKSFSSDIQPLIIKKRMLKKLFTTRLPVSICYHISSYLQYTNDNYSDHHNTYLNMDYHLDYFDPYFYY